MPTDLIKLISSTEQSHTKDQLGDEAAVNNEDKAHAMLVRHHLGSIINHRPLMF